MKTNLGIFLREPVRGRVKSRLAAQIGAGEACRLYVEFIKATMTQARLSGLPITLFCDPPAAAESLRARFQLAEPIVPQGPGDLGERMRRALAHLLNNADAAVLIGSDSPNLPVDYVRRSARALSACDCVIGPAADGGYYLIGLTRRGFERGAGSLFSGIPWGTPDVLEKTLQAARDRSLACVRLPEWYDIDRACDLARDPEIAAWSSVPAHYRGLGAQYAARWNAYINASARWIRELMPEHPGRVLDVGSGEGACLSRFLPDGARGVAVDWTRELLLKNNCRRRAAAVHDALPFKDGAFDTLVCSSSLHYNPFPAWAFGEFWRVLKPGGHLIVLDWADSIWMKWVRLRLKRRGVSVYLRSARAAAALAEAAGFTGRSCRTRRLTALWRLFALHAIRPS